MAFTPTPPFTPDGLPHTKSTCYVKVHWTFSGRGEGTELDISMRFLWQKSRKYENQEREVERATTHNYSLEEQVRPSFS